MAKAFNLTARLNLVGPVDAKPIIDKLKKQLKSVKVNVDIRLDPKVNARVKALDKSLARLETRLRSVKSLAASANASLSKLGKSFGKVSNGARANVRSQSQVNAVIASTGKGAAQAATEMEEFGRVSGLAIRRFAGFSIATGVIFGFISAVKTATVEAIKFDREIIKIAQVTGRSVGGLKSLTDEVFNLSTTLGVSSTELLNVARTLSQAGFSITEVRKALRAVAQSDLSPTFDSMKQTTEGAIAAINQFKLELTDLDSVLGSINAVSARFSVESGDIINAIRRTGGVFAAAAGDDKDAKQSLREFIALFTSIRATTRESSESIAVGLRTLISRLQRRSTVEFLRNLGVEVNNAEGQFVGAFEAVARLSKELNTLKSTDIRFSSIVEELGGIRQIGKIIPAIKEFDKAQAALKVATEGQNSTAKDAAIAQQALEVQFTKTKEKFLELINEVTKSDTFSFLTKGTLKFADTLISLASVLKPLLPLLAGFAAFKGLQIIGGITRGFRRGIGAGGAGGVGEAIGGIGGGSQRNTQAQVSLANHLISNTTAVTNNTTALAALTRVLPGLGTGRSSRLGAAGRTRFATGGAVGGSGSSDSQIIRAQAGEFVVNRRGVKKFGLGGLNSLNSTPQRLVTGSKGKLSTKSDNEAINKQDAPTPAKNLRFGMVGLRPIGAQGTRNVRIKAAKGDTSKRPQSVVQVKFAAIGKDIAREAKKGMNRNILQAVTNVGTTFATKLGARLDKSKIIPATKAAGLPQIQGTLFEASLQALGDPFEAAALKKRFKGSLDFPTGLGASSRLFPGVDGSLPTDAKRTVGNVQAQSMATQLGNFVRIQRAETKAAALKRASGGLVDTLLTPGELVFSPDAVQQAGVGNLRKFNKLGDPSGIQGFARGGVARVPGTGNRDTFRTMLESGSFVVRKSSSERFAAGGPVGMQSGDFPPGGLRGSSSRPFQSVAIRSASAAQKEVLAVRKRTLTVTQLARVEKEVAAVNKRGIFGQKQLNAENAKITQIQKQRASTLSSLRTKSKAARAGAGAGGGVGAGVDGAGFGGAAIGLLIAAPILQQAIGTKTAKAAGAGAGITGAIAGGTAGAALGSIIAPGLGTAVGAAVGGLVGAIVSYQQAFKQATDDLRDARIEKIINELGDSISSFSNNIISQEDFSQRVSESIPQLKKELAVLRFETPTSNAFGSTEDLNPQERAKEALFFKLAFDTMKEQKKFQKKLQDRSVKAQDAQKQAAELFLSEVKKNVASGATGADRFKNLSGGTSRQDALAFIGSLDDASRKNFLAAPDADRPDDVALGLVIADRISADKLLQDQLLASAKAAGEARKEMDLLGIDLLNMASKATVAATAGQSFRASLDTIANGFNSIATVKFNKLSKNLGIVGQGQIDQSFNQLRSFTGGGSDIDKLEKAFNDASILRNEGAAILAEAIAKGSAVDADSAATVFENALKDSDILRGLGDVIRNQFESSARQLFGGKRQAKGVTQSQIDKVVSTTATPATKKAQDALSAAVNSVEKVINEFAKNANLYAQSQLKAADVQDRIVQITAQRANQLKGLQGKEVSIQDILGITEARVRDASLGGGAGGSTDSRVLADRLISLQRRNEAIRARQPDAGRQEQTELIAEFADNTRQGKELEKALQLNATSTNALTAIEGKIAEIQQRREKGRGFVANLRAAQLDPKAAAELNRGIAGAAAILGGGKVDAKGFAAGNKFLNDIINLLPKEQARAARDRVAKGNLDALGLDKAGPAGKFLQKFFGDLEGQDQEANLIKTFQQLADKQLFALDQQVGVLQTQSDNLLGNLNKLFDAQLNAIRGLAGGGGGVVPQRQAQAARVPQQLPGPRQRQAVHEANQARIREEEAARDQRHEDRRLGRDPNGGGLQNVAEGRVRKVRGQGGLLNPQGINALNGFAGAANQLTVALNGLNNLAKQLQNINIPETIQIESAPIQVNVVINGAEAFENMQPALAQLVEGQIQRALINTINPITGETKESFGFNTV